ncbi:MAG: calcium-binding protein, partial [Hyphomicrobiaceae bacterium]
MITNNGNLRGTNSNDVFALAPGDGGILIENFQLGRDRLDFSAFGDDARIRVFQQETDAVVEIGDVSVKLQGINASTLTPSNLLAFPPGTESNGDLRGTNGDDIFAFAPGEGGNVISDFRPGQDRLDFSAFGDGARVRVFQQETDTVVEIGDVSVKLQGINADALTAASVVGAAFPRAAGEQVENDQSGVIRTGTDGNDDLRGADGNDELRGLGGNDRLAGGLGDDRLFGGDGDDFLLGQLGNDELFGGAGDDLLIGSTGNDRLDGGAGNDGLNGGVGNDVLFGGLGNDIFAFAPGDGNDVIGDFQVGQDQLDFSGFGDGVTATLRQDNDDTIVTVGDVSVRLEDVNVEELTAQSLIGATFQQAAIPANDPLRGTDGNDVFAFAPGEGSRLIENFQLGRDLLDFSAFSNDTQGKLFQQGADAVVEIGDVSVKLQGINANSLRAVSFVDVTLQTSEALAQTGLLRTGTEGNDVLTGTQRIDDLRGLGGDDLLVGGDGNDLLDGGAGNDRLFGQLGHDTLLGGAGNDLLDGGSGIDTLFGGAGNDALIGDAGNDRLFGGIGNDQLIGGSGNDRLSGGFGNDRLTGGIGNDRLTGGDGNDTFVFVPGDGNDVIGDFRVGQDRLDFSAFGNGATATLRQDNADTIVTVGDVSVRLENVDAAAVTAQSLVGAALPTVQPAPAAPAAPQQVDDGPPSALLQTGTDSSETLRGTNETDELRGLGGNDRLFGGAGDDRLFGG